MLKHSASFDWNALKSLLEHLVELNEVLVEERQTRHDSVARKRYVLKRETRSVEHVVEQS
jgi:hypothetical protein